jgi:hypothetical protein
MGAVSRPASAVQVAGAAKGPTVTRRGLVGASEPSYAGGG